MIISLCILVLPSLVLAGQFSTKKASFPTPSINFNVTSTIEDMIADMMENFCKTTEQWYKNDFILQMDEYRNEDEDTPAMQSKNYTISHGIISMTQFLPNGNQMTPEISCKFSENLEVRTTIPSFQFRSHFNLTNNEDLTVLTYRYVFDIQNIGLTFTTEPDFNIEDSLPNNQSKVDISYGQVNITFETVDTDDIHGFEEMREMVKKIKSSLKSSILEKLTSHIKTPIYSYVSVYSVCMNPRNEIIRYHRTFEAREMEHYYETDGLPPVSCDFLNLRVAPIKIRGLWNFDTFNASFRKVKSGINYNRYNHSCGCYEDNYIFFYNFDLKITNIEGETTWYIQEDFESNTTKSNEVKFTIDTLSIKGSKRRESSSFRDTQIDVNFQLSLEDSNNNDSWFTLFRKMVLKRIEPALRTTFSRTIFQKFLSYKSYPYY